MILTWWVRIPKKGINNLLLHVCVPFCACVCGITLVSQLVSCHLQHSFLSSSKLVFRWDTKRHLRRMPEQNKSIIWRFHSIERISGNNVICTCVLAQIFFFCLHTFIVTNEHKVCSTMFGSFVHISSSANTKMMVQMCVVCAKKSREINQWKKSFEKRKSLQLSPKQTYTRITYFSFLWISILQDVNLEEKFVGNVILHFGITYDIANESLHFWIDCFFF